MRRKTKQNMEQTKAFNTIKMQTTYASSNYWHIAEKMFDRNKDTFFSNTNKQETSKITTLSVSLLSDSMNVISTYEYK